METQCGPLRDLPTGKLRGNRHLGKRQDGGGGNIELASSMEAHAHIRVTPMLPRHSPAPGGAFALQLEWARQYRRPQHHAGRDVVGLVKYLRRVGAARDGSHHCVKAGRGSSHGQTLYPSHMSCSMGPTESADSDAVASTVASSSASCEIHTANSNAEKLPESIARAKSRCGRRGCVQSWDRCPGFSQFQQTPRWRCGGGFERGSSIAPRASILFSSNPCGKIVASDIPSPCADPGRGGGG